MAWKLAVDLNDLKPLMKGRFDKRKSCRGAAAAFCGAWQVGGREREALLEPNHGLFAWCSRCFSHLCVGFLVFSSASAATTSSSVALTLSHRSNLFVLTRLTLSGAPSATSSRAEGVGARVVAGSRACCYCDSQLNVGRWCALDAVPLL